MPNHCEAPVSLNAKYITPQGFTCQLTMRGDDDNTLEAFHDTLSQILALGCRPHGTQTNTPTTKANTSQATNNDQNHDDDPAWCPIHNCAMQKRSRNGNSWYSHKLGEDDWCRGK